MPKCYWGEAIAVATYILNLCPTKRLNCMTPEHVWSGKKPSIKHLRVFGSVCYRHIPDEKRRKLDAKSERLVFIGYHVTGAYRLYEPVVGKILISRDVRFDEEATWNWEMSSSGPKPTQLSLTELELETATEPESKVN
jgi:hypothetical protein